LSYHANDLIKSLSSPASSSPKFFLTGVSNYESKSPQEKLRIPSPSKPPERKGCRATHFKLKKYKSRNRDTHFVPNVIWDMLDKLRDSAQAAEEIIIEAGSAYTSSNANTYTNLILIIILTNRPTLATAVDPFTGTVI
jgi:hypothetical protein